MNRHSLTAMAGTRVLVGGGGYPSPTRPSGPMRYSPRPMPYYVTTYTAGRQCVPGRGKRRYMKRKYIRRRSGYFMHKRKGGKQ